MDGKLQILLAMAGYMLIVIAIGLFFAKKSQANSENYFLGGRSLGPWVAAMSAEASDMSGWLLMGLPGVAYWCGIADAAWTAIGLAIGTYVNWLIVSKRLRAYSIISGDSITVPDFLSNRYHEKKKVILGISAVFILIFFTIYAASCFVTCGKLFSGLFGYSYHSMMLVGAAFVLVYTILGGFLAESASDFMQAVVMICALVGVGKEIADRKDEAKKQAAAKKAEDEALRKGLQAVLRALMLQEYYKYIDLRYAPVDVKQNFENLWKSYETLGKNGVMSHIHDDFIDLPTEPPAKT